MMLNNSLNWEHLNKEQARYWLEIFLKPETNSLDAERPLVKYRDGGTLKVVCLFKKFHNRAILMIFTNFEI